MEKSMNIESLIKAKQDVLESKLTVLLSHPTTKGDHCESVWIDFFRSFLPNKYAVDKGFVFDSKGGVSDQIDIIIYDAAYTPLIFSTDSGEKFITAESVYAVFESKQVIDKSTLSYADKKIDSVKQLYRTSRPYKNGDKEEKKLLTKILGGILAVRGEEIETVKKNLKEYINISMGCAIENYAFVIRREENEDEKEVVYETKEKVILGLFYMILDELHKLGSVAAIDIREYAESAHINIR